MRKVFRWAWNSPTATTWFNKLVGPLRLLVLTPLVTRLPEVEVGVFGLLASGLVLLTVVEEALQLTFVRMLSYAHGGAVDLSPIAEGDSRLFHENPNWEAFRRAVPALFFLQLAIALPVLIFGACTVGYGIGRLIEWDWSRWDLWLTLGLFSANQAFLLATSRLVSALKATGHIAEINRVSSCYLVASVLAGATVLALTQSLPQLIATQALVAAVQRIAIQRLALRRIPELDRSTAFAVRRDRAITKACWRPLWRSTCGSLATRGVRAITAIHVAGLVPVWGLSSVVSFNFSMNLIMTVMAFSNAPVASHTPRLARLLAQGDQIRLRKATLRGLVYSTVIFFAAMTAIGLLGPWALRMIESNVELISAPTWWFATGLFALLHVQSLLAIICNLDNRVRFFWRNLLAAMLIIAVILWRGPSLTQEALLIALTVPYVLTAELSPARGFLRMVGFAKPRKARMAGQVADPARTENHTG